MKQVYIKTIEQTEIGKIKLPKGITVKVFGDTIFISFDPEIKDCISLTSVISKFDQFFNTSNLQIDGILEIFQIHFKIDKECNHVNCSKHENYNTWTFYTKEVKEIPVKDKLDGMSTVIDVFEE